MSLMAVCQDSVKTLEREMWRRSTEHNVDIDKWIRDDIQTRALVQFSSSSSRPQASRVMVSGQQNTRCSDPVCRLPCSLQPLEPGHPRPRPRLETEADWARARQEVEARRERGRREEAAMVENNDNNKTKYLGSDGAF